MDGSAISCQAYVPSTRVIEQLSRAEFRGFPAYLTCGILRRTNRKRRIADAIMHRMHDDDEKYSLFELWMCA